MFSRLCRPSSGLLRFFSHDPLKLKITPHQYYITQGKGTERAFTGEYWNNHDLGSYHCVVCKSLLFPSIYKFYPDSGYCAFFTHEPGAVLIEEKAEERKEVKCAKCSSHLGHVFPQKLPPTNQHFQINSASLSFEAKAWFKVPPSKNEKRRQRTQLESEVKKQQRKAEKKAAKKTAEKKTGDTEKPQKEEKPAEDKKKEQTQDKQ